MKTRTQEIQHILVAIATAAISLLPIAPHGQQADPAKTPSPPGTYYSAQSWDSPKMPVMAPLPFNPFPDLPVYSIGEGRFIYDDREVDYVTLRQEAAEMAAADNSPAGEMLAAQAGASGPTLHIGNMGNGQLAFAIRMAEADSVWDLYFVNNVVAERWQWRRVYSGVKCDANGEASFSMQQPDPSQGFFVVLNAADDDGDGLGNGYEAWFKYGGLTTVTNARDSDFDNMPDGWEVEYGLNPTSAAGIDGATGNPDGDLQGDGSPLSNLHEFFLYRPNNSFNGSHDPLKPYGTSENRPVVWVSTSTPTPACETASFTIHRAGGDAADYTQPLFVYYSVGGELRYDTDYTLTPAPVTNPGEQDHPDGYPRIFVAKIPENSQSVTVVASFIGHPVTSGSKKLQMALTPYSVSRKTQVASATDWSYVVDWQNKMDRATSTFDIANLRPVASGQFVQTCRNTPLQITLSDASHCGSPLTFSIVNPPVRGSLSAITPIDNNTRAAVTYTPNTDFCGLDGFTFKINNFAGDSQQATVTIQVGDPNPVGDCQDVTTKVGQAITFTVTANDFCSEPKTFIVRSGSGPAHGQLAGPTPIDANHASFTYTPNPGFEGTDEFGYEASGICLGPSAFPVVTIHVVSDPVLFASCRADRINLRWKPPLISDPNPDAFFQDFRIYRCETTGASCTPTVLYATVAPGSTHGFVDTAVQPGTTYCYRIKFRHQNACDPSDIFESEFSNTVCTQPCAPSVRALVTGHVATGGILTADFTDGRMVTSFGTVAPGFGRGVAIHNNEIFYTAIGSGDNSIHVCPYGTEGSGGPDTRTFQNTWRPGSGIADLDVHAGVLYVLTGYTGPPPLRVFKLDPVTGALIGDPLGIAIPGPATQFADGFTVLPNGNFLINDNDGAANAFPYREYSGTSGMKIEPPQGLQIGLGNFGFRSSRGVATAPDGQSLYFIADSGTLVQTDLAGNLMGFQDLRPPAADLEIEDIDVVLLPP